MCSCTETIASMVDFIGSVVTLVWYMVVFYGLWKLKDVRYEAPVRRVRFAPVARRRYTRPEWDLLTEEEQKKVIKEMITVHIHDV
jgi:hypothetical protein